MASTTSAASPGARLPAHYIINSSTYQTVGDRAFVADCDMTDYIKKGDEYAKIFSTKANATLDVELGCVPGTDPKSGKARSGVRYLQSVLATKAQGAQRKQERTKAAATRVQTELAQAAAARQTTWQHQNVQEQLIAQLAASNAQQTAAMRQEGASLAAATLAAREIGDAMGASGNTCLGDGGSGMCSNCGDVSLPHRCIFSDSKVLRMSQKGEGSLSGHTPRATKGSNGDVSDGEDYDIEDYDMPPRTRSPALAPFVEYPSDEDAEGDGSVHRSMGIKKKMKKGSCKEWRVSKDRRICMGLQKKQLKSIAQGYGLSTSGNKADLVNRIVDAKSQQKPTGIAKKRIAAQGDTALARKDAALRKADRTRTLNKIEKLKAELRQHGGDEKGTRKLRKSLSNAVRKALQFDRTWESVRKLKRTHSQQLHSDAYCKQHNLILLGLDPSLTAPRFRWEYAVGASNP